MGNVRYDKYDPIVGGFRAPLNADLSLTDGSIGPVGVSINNTGRVVVGNGGTSGTIGVLVKNVRRGPLNQWSTTLVGTADTGGAKPGAKAGDIVDVMTSGEIMGVPTFTAGQQIYALANGTLSSTSAAGAVAVGFMVEAGRMVVRCAGPAAFIETA